MQRNTTLLKDKLFDVVIVGGGIYGSTIYHQLTAAGLSVALIDKEDFCSATSANSLKILHGGLRYLQHLNIKRMRESINSRKYYMQMAPHLIKPMPCIMPTYGLGMQGRPIMGIAMMVFDTISWDRNQGAPVANRVGHGKLLSVPQTLRIGPGINQDGLSGAALWYDDMITNTERMALSFIKEGSKMGGTAANYVKVRNLIRKGNHISGVEATDELSEKNLIIKANLVINTAGPWIDDIRKEVNQAQTTEDLSKAVNIVINKPLFKGHGVGLSGTEEFTDQDAKIKRGKRLFFFAPWKQNTIIGTTYSYYSEDRDALHVTQSDIAEILDEVNTIYPTAELTPDDVVFAHVGLMPAHNPGSGTRGGTPQLVKHSRIIDHEKLENLIGLITVEGVKYTTAPTIARDVKKLLQRKKIINAGTTHATPNKVPYTSTEQQLRDHYSKRFPHIEENYGRDGVEIFALAANEAGGTNLIRKNPALIEAEVIYCVRHEMAVRLGDVLFRRTDCGTTGRPKEKELLEIAGIMSTELGWDEQKVRYEIDAVHKYYTNFLAIPS